MKDKHQSEKQEREEMELQETYNDDHWLRKYGVSSDELKAITAVVGLPAKIIRINSENKYLAV